MAVQEDLGMEADDVVQAFLVPTLANGEVYFLPPSWLLPLVRGKRHTFQERPSFIAPRGYLRFEERFQLLEY